MAKNDLKEVYVCNNCGAEFPKWSGKCPECGAWDTLFPEIKEKKIEYNGVKII